MLKNIILLILFLPIYSTMWFRIPKFEVENYMSNFLNSNQINNCFYNFEKDTIFLKCLRNIELIDIKIFLNYTKLYT